MASDINADLPVDVRIFAIKKVGKAFDMRHDTCSRIYNYIAPLRLFYSKDQFTSNAVLNEMEQHEIVSKINDLAQLYLGTHSFHNFTRGYRPADRRNDRFITNMKVELVERDVVERASSKLHDKEDKLQENQEASSKDHCNRGMAFVRFTLVGQSFIYHQIRKMVGLIIRICHEGLEGPETVKTAFGKEKFHAFLTPGEGLYLNRMTFDQYNRKKEGTPHQVRLNEQDEGRVLEFRKYLEGLILMH